MARRAKFGLQPRVQADIRGQLVAIAREQEAQEEQNIMDAWRNGGNFNGAPATDDRVLAYWKAREKGLDPHDPLYDEAKNNIMQLEYSIAMSKQDVLHAQNKISDQQYAQFFLKWAKKVPKNSEFYRTLQRDAANLIESAKARSRTSANAAKTKAFNDYVTGVTDKDIVLGNALTKALGDMASATGLNIIDHGQQLLDMVAADVKAYPKKYGILVTALGSHWNGTLTEHFVAQAISSATNGYTKIANRADKEGFASAYYSNSDSAGKMASWGQNLSVWSEAKSYDAGYQRWSAIWTDPHSSTKDKAAADAQMIDVVQGLIGKTTDPGAKAALQADLDRLSGKVGGDIAGFGAYIGHRAEFTINDGTASQSLVNKTAQDAMTANPDLYSYAPVDKNGNFDQTGEGPIGIVDNRSIPANSTQVVVTSKTGQPTLVTVATHPVYTSDPENPGAAKVKVGEAVTYWTGATQVTQFGYRDSAGKMQWSPDTQSPFTAGASITREDNGDWTVGLPKQTPYERALELDKQYGSNIALNFVQTDPATGKQSVNQSVMSTNVSIDGKDSNGQRWRRTIAFNNGQFTVTQQSVTTGTYGADTLGTSVTLSGNRTPEQLAGMAYSTSRLSAGDVPGATHSSPLQASIDDGRSRGSADQTSAIVNDPAFQKAWLQQTMDSKGTTNPLDGSVAAEWTKTVSLSLTPDNAGKPMYAPNGRTDLKYPGPSAEDAKNAANSGSLTLNWGKQALKLPNVPGYANGAQVDIPPAFIALVNGVMGMTKLGATGAGVMPSTIPNTSAGMTPVVAATPTSVPSPTSKPVDTSTGAASAPVASAPPAAAPPPPPKPPGGFQVPR